MVLTFPVFCGILVSETLIFFGCYATLLLCTHSIAQNFRQVNTCAENFQHFVGLHKMEGLILCIMLNQ